MSADIGPGDTVQAILNSCGGGGLQSISAGSIYFVDRITHSQVPCLRCKKYREGTSLVLVGDRPISEGVGWCAPCAFRPFRGPDLEAELFRAKPPANKKQKLMPQDIINAANERLLREPLRYPSPEETKKQLEKRWLFR